VTDEQRRDQAGTEAKEQGEAKSDEQRDAEEKFSQGGQDVEEAEHEEPEPAG
jgi:hypothetical protein